MLLHTLWDKQRESNLSLRRMENNFKTTHNILHEQYITELYIKAFQWYIAISQGMDMRMTEEWEISTWKSGGKQSKRRVGPTYREPWSQSGLKFDKFRKSLYIVGSRIDTKTLYNTLHNYFNSIFPSGPHNIVWKVEWILNQFKDMKIKTQIYQDHNH